MEPGQASGGGTCLKSSTSASLLAFANVLLRLREVKQLTESHTALRAGLEHGLLSKSPHPHHPWPSLPSPAGRPWPPHAPACPHLEQSSCHVEDDEDEGEGGMPTLHTADGVEKHQVSWDHEEEEHGPS